MSVLAFRHVPYEHLGLIAPVLEAAGLRYEYVDLPLDLDRRVDLDSASGLVFMGGPMSVNDDLPYLRKEVTIIREAEGRGLPILGVCLGAQLIAKAFGASVYRNEVKEIGWYPVYWTAEAAEDSLLAGLPSPATVFHWHGETFDLPSDAIPLAYSDSCRNQAFRYGDCIYGLQFHLEVTPAMIGGWLEEDANAADLREVNHPVDPNAGSEELARLGEAVFRRWASLAGGQPSEVALF
ncbi:MAG: gamma-glutamyl-gamma-aminobutyrate hydrolase family protein [Acidobacteriales bacterium]|nr:gamma-glutamyl-gamma-aminobutyrate hydrolase family protein [Terriglobales bacterium]